MDILIHGISGLAVGSVLVNFTKRGTLSKTAIVLMAGFGGIFPDVDAISLWSRFDAVFGMFFELAHSGNEIYFSKYWYSHHAFFHSIVCALILALFIGILHYFIQSRFRNICFSQLLNSLRCSMLWKAFAAGYLIHLLEDMPTPGGVWGGVNFFWPLRSYVGGTGNIWWWNNYDIFLIAVSVFTINMLVQALSGLLRPNWAVSIASIVFVLGFCLAFFQIKTRNYDFDYTGHTKRYDEFERKSKLIQKSILGERVYSVMERVDKAIPLNF